MLAGGAASAVVIASSAGSALAAPVNSNGSFETGVAPGVFTTLVGVNNTNITDWTVDSGSVDYIGSYWMASDGTRSLDMTGFSSGTVSQTFPTVIGHTYEVSFDMAGNPAGFPLEKHLDVSVGGAPESFTFDVTGKTLVDMGWETNTYEFTATSTSTTLSFASQDAGFFGAALDNVVVTDALTDKDQCKKGGWMAYTDPSFKNQGDCVSNAQSNPHAIGN